MNLVFQAAGKTDIGLVRTNNEDNFGFDLRRGIFVVCDGMGGAAAGEVASKIAVDTVLEYFRNDSGRAESPVLGRKFEGVSEYAAGLGNAIQLANQAIQEAAAHNPNRSGMGSTIVAVCVHGMFFSIANVGDSRIYLARGGRIQQLTSDHSLVMEQVRRGLMTVEEAEKSDMQNVIVRALGSEDRPGRSRICAGRWAAPVQRRHVALRQRTKDAGGDERCELIGRSMQRTDRSSQERRQ